MRGGMDATAAIEEGAPANGGGEVELSGVFVAVYRQEGGGVVVDVRTVGDVRQTETETLLRMGVRAARSRLRRGMG